MIVAISGFAGTGKTSLAEELKEALEERGFRVAVYTPTLRDLAKERGVDLLTIQEEAKKNPEIDLELDETTRRKVKDLSKGHDVVIVSSWLAIHVVDAQLKVFLYAPLSVRVERLAKRDGLSIEEAEEHIRRREEQNRERWKRLYSLDMDELIYEAHLALNAGLLSLEEEVEMLAKEVVEKLERGNRA